jgi:nucleosome assembly protein 1-like 1
MSKGKAFNMASIENELEKSSISDLPVSVQRRVRALKNAHKEHVDLEKKYRDEVAALERKYQALYAPLYSKRASIVKGDYEPTDAETHVEGEEPLANTADKGVKGIPKFWLTVLKNNPSVGDSITDADEDALSYLQDVRQESVEGDKGFVLTFHFAENPYFSDAVLTKTYHLVDDDGVYGELVFDRAEGTKINWKPGKNLTVKVKKQQQKSRGSRGRRGGGGAARVTTVEEPCESFFHFFNPPSVDTEDADEEEEGLLDDMLEADFELGCIFKDKLVPHSVLWFTGEALEFEDDFDDFDYDEDDLDEEDDEEEEDEEEEEEEEERPTKKGGPTKRGGRGQLPPQQKGGAPAQPQQAECKQQ